MTDEDTSMHNWTHGAGVKVVTSTDGVNWGSKVSVFGVQTNWAGMLGLDNTRFLVLGDNGGAKAQLMGFEEDRAVSSGGVRLSLL